MEDIIYKSIKDKRTIRIFKKKRVEQKILEKCVDAAKDSSCARNDQQIEYIIVDDKSKVSQIIKNVRFGGEISKDKKAVKGHEPDCFIVLISKSGIDEYIKYDKGIACQNISLVAYENKVGSCIMGAIDREEIKNILNVPKSYEINIVIALGYLDEKPIIEESKGETTYYRKENVLHVPKKRLGIVLHKNKF